MSHQAGGRGDAAFPRYEIRVSTGVPLVWYAVQA
jgi:hypothetical protein